jgi:DNA-binding transcriptional ArsR family regulator
MQQTEIVITNILATKTAFAVRSDDMTANVFIPSKLSLDADLRPGKKMMASLIPNIQQPDKTPWLCIALHDDAPIQPPQPQGRRDTLAELILENLDQGRATVEEIAEDLNMSDESVANKLSELFATGRVVRLTCFDLPGDKA